MAKNPKKKPGSEDGVKQIAVNRKARFRYEILDRFEAGIELVGSEVKSLRDGGVSIAESFAKIKGNQVFVVGLNIDPYPMAAHKQHESLRMRRLLLHKSEIKRISIALERKGLTLVPLRLYWKGGFAKLEIAIARGRAAPDKRQQKKQADVKRELSRELKRGK